MAFLEQCVEFGEWYEIDGPNGTEFVPADLIGEIDLSGFNGGPIPDELRDYSNNREAFSIEKRSGYGARLSAPGYLDCTEWSVFDTEQEAQEYLAETYGDDDSEPSEPEEGDITTADHCQFYQYGKLVLEIDIEADHCAALRDFMEREKFWPNCWFISDHGNAHLLTIN